MAIIQHELDFYLNTKDHLSQIEKTIREMGPVQPIEMPGLDRFQPLRIEHSTNVVPQLMPPSITVETSPRTQLQPTIIVSSPTGALPPSPRVNSPVRYVRAMYDFDAAAPEELSFKVGDEFTVTTDPGGGWLRVLSKTGQQGIVPANYVTPL